MTEATDLDAQIAALEAERAALDEKPEADSAQPPDDAAAEDPAGAAAEVVEPDPTQGSDPTPSEDSASVSPEVAPEPDPQPTSVIPTGAPGDTRELDAMRAAGTAPGLSNAADKAHADLDSSIAAIKKWVLFMEDAARRVKTL